MNSVITVIIIVFFEILNGLLFLRTDQTTRGSSQDVLSVLLLHAQTLVCKLGRFATRSGYLMVIIFICFLSQQSRERCLHSLILQRSSYRLSVLQ